MRACWEREALERPTFNRLKKMFQAYKGAAEVGDE
jgi:hypothetical protein